MSFKIIAIGSLNKDPSLNDLAQYYLKLISYKTQVIEIDKKIKGDSKKVIVDEGKFLIEKKTKFSVLLTENGTQYSSHNFAQFISSSLNIHSEISFLIGGAYGISDEVREAASTTLSLSVMTFSHLIARVILLEQLYRAQTIIQGHPYHK